MRVVPSKVPLGVRIPVRVQGSPLGSVNTSAGGRAIPPPTLVSEGPAQLLEMFGGGNGIPENVARALNQIQTNIAKAMSQVKESPFADGNLIEKFPLVNGGAAGAAPYTIINHGLGKPYRGAFILSTTGGYVTASAIVANSTASLDSAQIQLWTLVTAFAGVSQVLANIWVYA